MGSGTITAFWWSNSWHILTSTTRRWYIATHWWYHPRWWRHCYRFWLRVYLRVLTSMNQIARWNNTSTTKSSIVFWSICKDLILDIHIISFRVFLNNNFAVHITSSACNGSNFDFFSRELFAVLDSFTWYSLIISLPIKPSLCEIIEWRKRISINSIHYKCFLIVL